MIMVSWCDSAEDTTVPGEAESGSDVTGCSEWLTLIG